MDTSCENCRDLAKELADLQIHANNLLLRLNESRQRVQQLLARYEVLPDEARVDL